MGVQNQQKGNGHLPNGADPEGTKLGTKAGINLHAAEYSHVHPSAPDHQMRMPT